MIGPKRTNSPQVVHCSVSQRIPNQKALQVEYIRLLCRLLVPLQGEVVWGGKGGLRWDALGGWVVTLKGSLKQLSSASASPGQSLARGWARNAQHTTPHSGRGQHSLGAENAQPAPKGIGASQRQYARLLHIVGSQGRRAGGGVQHGGWSQGDSEAGTYPQLSPLWCCCSSSQQRRGSRGKQRRRRGSRGEGLPGDGGEKLYGVPAFIG
jgi:hypothetical protein